MLAILAAADREVDRRGRKRRKERSRAEKENKQGYKDSAHSVFRVQEGLKASKRTPERGNLLQVELNETESIAG